MWLFSAKGRAVAKLRHAVRLMRTVEPVGGDQTGDGPAFLAARKAVRDALGAGLDIQNRQIERDGQPDFALNTLAAVLLCYLTRAGNFFRSGVSLSATSPEEDEVLKPVVSSLKAMPSLARKAAAIAGVRLPEDRLALARPDAPATGVDLFDLLWNCCVHPALVSPVMLQRQKLGLPPNPRPTAPPKNEPKPEIVSLLTLGSKTKEKLWADLPEAGRIMRELKPLRRGEEGFDAWVDRFNRFVVIYNTYQKQLEHLSKKEVSAAAIDGTLLVKMIMVIFMEQAEDYADGKPLPSPFTDGAQRAFEIAVDDLGVKPMMASSAAMLLHAPLDMTMDSLWMMGLPGGNPHVGKVLLGRLWKACVHPDWKLPVELPEA
jgi:hypothetical protein